MRSGARALARLHQTMSLRPTRFLDSITAARFRWAEICPFDRAVPDAPARVGVVLDVDQLLGFPAVLGATTSAIAVRTRVIHRDDDRLTACSQAQIVELQCREVRE